MMAVEFIAYYAASNNEICLQNFVTELCIVDGIDKPLKLFCGYKLVVLYSNKNQSSTRLKHIDIKFLVVQEGVQSGQLSNSSLAQTL